MYMSSPAKTLTFTNFMALPLTSRPLFTHPLYTVPGILSILFCVLAACELIHMAWSYFHPNHQWD